MSAPTTKAVVSAFCLALLSSAAFAQGAMQIPAQGPNRGNDQQSQTGPNPAGNQVQGAQTGTARNSDTTSPNTRDPALGGSQTTDGRSPGTMSGPSNAARDSAQMPRTSNTEGRTMGQTNPATSQGHPSGIRNDTSSLNPGQTTAPVNRSSGINDTEGTGRTNAQPERTGITNAPVGQGTGMGGATTGMTNAAPGGAGTGITNAPVGAAMDNSAGGRAAANADTDRDRRGRDGSANIAPVVDQNERRAEMPGANSFTEGQARSRIEDAGFSQVGQLTKDQDGVWRGTAMREGRQVQVGLDFRGNVTHR